MAVDDECLCSLLKTKRPAGAALLRIVGRAPATHSDFPDEWKESLTFRARFGPGSSGLGEC